MKELIELTKASIEDLPSIYCDMDGVLVDFIKGADAAVGDSFVNADKANCIMCHSGSGSNNLNLTSYANVMDGNSDHGPVIIPFDAGNSILVQKILGTASFGGRMPSSNPTYFDSNLVDLQLIKDWINQGALEKPGD